METMYGRKIREHVKLCGRTYMDKEDTLYFDWTCAGMEFQFQGSCLMARFRVMPEMVVRQIPGETPGTTQTKEEEDWPWIAVFLDGGETPYHKFPLDREELTAVIFESDKEETHRIRIVKLTECFRSAVGISQLKMEGKVWPAPKAAKRIEYIGDSITCGFGNDTNEGNRDFYSGEENGWMTYAALTARKLEMDADFVSVSGITVAKTGDFPGPYAMNEIYPYTNRILQDKLARKRGEEKARYEVWDFAGHVPDYIVLNLGTNDSTQVGLSGDIQRAEEKFEEDYYHFLEMIRKYNGYGPKLICTLGSIDFYLYDRILHAAERFRREKKDENIFCFKFTKMLMMGADVGACFHPSIRRHEKMAKELTAFIQELERKEEQ